MAQQTLKQWWQHSKNRLSSYSRRCWRWLESRRLRLHDFEDGLSKLVSIVLRVGTLALILLLLVFVYRLFKDEGYLIEAFSVPDHLSESGYTGAVVAKHLQDEVVQLKEYINSSKQDSIVLVGEQEPQLDLAVMGIGLSLNSITYHLRKVFGYHSKTIRGEITRLDDEYTLHLRMTDFPKQIRRITVKNGDEAQAMEDLMQSAAEAFLANIDPYRLAVYCYREERYEEAMQMIRKVLEERPNEHHWAYLAWGGVLQKQGYPEAAIRKFRQALDVKPDFTLAWRRLTWTLHETRQYEQSLEAVSSLFEIEPDNADSWVNMAWMVNSQGHHELADSFFQTAQRLKPNNPNFYASEADAKFSRGEFQEAAALIAKADSLMGTGGGGQTTMIRSFIAMVQGDTAKAIRNAYESWDLNPDNADVTNVAIRAARMQKDYEKARQIYNRQAWKEFYPYRKQQFLNQMAMTFNELGMPDSAMVCVQKAIAVDESTGYPYSTLAEVYAYQNDIEQFYYYLELAFQKGMSVTAIENSNMEPYNSLVGNARYEALLNKYRKIMPVAG